MAGPGTMCGRGGAGLGLCATITEDEGEKKTRRERKFISARKVWATGDRAERCLCHGRRRVEHVAVDRPIRVGK